MNDRELLALVAKWGRVENGSKHFKLYAPTGQLVGILPKGRNRQKNLRGQKNLLAQLRRAGMPERA